MQVNRTNYRNVLKSKLGRSKFLNQDEVDKVKSMLKQDKIPVMFNDIKEDTSDDYLMVAYGILPCGTKVAVLIEGINPSIDIEFDDKLSKQGNLKRVQDLLAELSKSIKQAPSIHSLKIRNGKKLIGYSKEESKFIQVSFKKLWQRKAFIQLLKKRDIASYNNDESTYYRVVGRQYKLALSGWNVLNNFCILNNRDYRTKYVISVDINDICKFEESSFPELDSTMFRKEKLISMAFDIEQYSSDFNPAEMFRDTRLPSGEVLEDTIFNIGMTFHFINEPNEILGLSLITEKCQEHEGYITIVCDSEKTLLLSFGYIIGLMQPDIIYEFNGSDFDWPNIYKKCGLLKIQDTLLDSMSMCKLSGKTLATKNKFIFMSDYIKISSEMTDKRMTNLRLPGYVAFDLRISLMQLNPTESKSSLSFYLEHYNMPGKDDMPIPVLFKHFATKDYNGLGDVAKYCFIDCLRLHQLVYKINLIQDKKAVGLLSFTSLFDAFYRANSCKVRNLVVAHALDANLFYDGIKKDVNEEDKREGKYPGAFVLNPTTGLVKPMMSFEEFCKVQLGVEDKNTIEEGLKILKSKIETLNV